MQDKKEVHIEENDESVEVLRSRKDHLQQILKNRNFKASGWILTNLFGIVAVILEYPVSTVELNTHQESS